MSTENEFSVSCLQLLCDRYIRQENLEEYRIKKFSLYPASSAPSGFLGCHQFLKLSCAYRNRHGIEEHKTIKFFVKTAPTNAEALKDYLDDFGVFNKEIVVYSKILSHLKFTNEEIAPKCYLAQKNLLIFEDLSQLGYKTAATRDGILNYEHLELAIKKLALMHAGSIIFEKKIGKKIVEAYIETVEENAYPLSVADEHVRRKNVSLAISVFLEILKEIPKYANVYSTLTSKIKDKFEYIFDLVQTSSEYQNVFSHGDLWANNVMFNYNADNLLPISCKFVDFQLARYAPPMLDLVTLLTIPSTRTFRKLYFEELVTKYYNFLKDYLKENNLNIQYILTETQFMEGIAKYREAGLIESCLFSHLTILPTEYTKKLTGSSEGFKDYFSNRRVNICLEAFHTDDIYRSRLLDMFEDLIENYILPNNV